MYGAIVSPHWPEDTSPVVEPSRLAIYRDMYPIRMFEAMSVDFPALALFLGEEKFNDLAGRFTEVHRRRATRSTGSATRFPSS